MAKNEQLDLLFDKWEKSNPLYEGKFVRDGIFEEEQFEKQNVKILFLCKEPNNPRQAPGDFRDKSFALPSSNFFFSISEWAYGLLNGFPVYDSINNKKRKEALSCIALMNLKKSGGGSTSNRKEIEQHIRENKTYMLKQIEIIRPDIIIGSAPHFLSWKFLFEMKEYFKTGHGINYLIWEELPVIDFYHPSARGGRAASYALLKQVFESNFEIRTLE